MNTIVFAAMAVALVVSVFAFIREVRLRRALQRLLELILDHVRSHETNDPTDGRDVVDDRRL